MLADSGEDAITFSDVPTTPPTSQTARAADPAPRTAPGEKLRKVDTPTQKT